MGAHAEPATLATEQFDQFWIISNDPTTIAVAAAAALWQCCSSGINIRLVEFLTYDGTGDILQWQQQR
jgi:hypothetical protein